MELFWAILICSKCLKISLLEHISSVQIWYRCTTWARRSC